MLILFSTVVLSNQPNDNHGNRRQIMRKTVFFEKIESLSFSRKGSIPKKALYFEGLRNTLILNLS